MARVPLREKPDKGRPRIWASGGQRPPLSFGAVWRASLHLSREAVASLHAWTARMARRVAVNVKNGAGRIPEEKLGRAARFVPSHLRVAAWIRNFGATLAHASATADPDVTRGNALVADIQRPLWDQPVPEPMPEPDPLPEPAVSTTPDTAPPVVLAEPTAPTHDPLAAIRDDLAGKPGQPAVSAPAGPASPPAPPGALAEGAIQVSGWLIGWASAIVALPYGFCRAIWLWLNGTDLKRIGTED